MPSTLGALDRLPVINEGDSSKKERRLKLHDSGNYIWTRAWKNVLGHRWGRASAASDLFAAVEGLTPAGYDLALHRMEEAGTRLTARYRSCLSYGAIGPSMKPARRSLERAEHDSGYGVGLTYAHDIIHPGAE